MCFLTFLHFLIFFKYRIKSDKYECGRVEICTDFFWSWVGDLAVLHPVWAGNC